MAGVQQIILPKRRYVALRGSEFPITRDVQAEEGQSHAGDSRGRKYLTVEGRIPDLSSRSFSSGDRGGDPGPVLGSTKAGGGKM